jgi:general stress protein 26
MNEQAKKEALEFLMSQKVGVLSTIADGKPHGAHVNYVVDENLDIYFITPIGSGKQKHISSNKNVAFTVGTAKPPKTVQVEGEAEAVTDDATIKAVVAQYVDDSTENNKNPVPLGKLDKPDGVIMYRIRPLWLKWSDFTDSKEKGKKTSVVIIGS